MADEACSKEVRKLTIFASTGEVLVWDADTVLKLRSKYRIIGSLIGSLPRKPRQNVFLSLPLVLSENETTLLLEKKVVELKQSDSAPPLPSEDKVKRLDFLREESMHEQARMFLEEREEKKQELSEVIEEGRKRKRNRRKKGNGNVSNMTEKVTRLDGECNNTTRNHILHSCKKNQEEITFSETSSCLNEPQAMELYNSTNEPSVCDPQLVEADLATTNGDETFKRLQGTVVHIPTKSPHAITGCYPFAKWSYPNTENEHLRYSIFKNLWERGLYITSGCKFGGDFLAYPGDPVKFHSFYIVVVVPYDKRTGMLDVVSMGRLGATVKKTAVFASMDSGGNVVYMSVKWSGIS